MFQAIPQFSAPVSSIIISLPNNGNFSTLGAAKSGLGVTVCLTFLTQLD